MNMERGSINWHAQLLHEEYEADNAQMIGEPATRPDGGHVAAYQSPQTKELYILMEASDGQLSVRFDRAEVLEVGENDFMSGVVKIVGRYRMARSTEEVWDTSVSPAE